MGRLALNKLRAVVARKCYDDSLRLGPRLVNDKRISVNFLDLDLDPCHHWEDSRLCLVKELKEVQIGPSIFHKTKVDITLDVDTKDHLVHFLTKNRNVFAWSLVDMPGIDLDFLCHRLCITPRTRAIA
ncbi:hypothetical protein CR513_04771, partial [Mucuna pruriens]